jgi:hypothetical protein
MDSLGKPLLPGKYYVLETGQLGQYTGTENGNHLFEHKNRIGKKIVLRKFPATIENKPPIPDNNEDDYGTDNEYMDDPYNLSGGRRTIKTRKMKKMRKMRKNKTRTRNKGKKFN